LRTKRDVPVSQVMNPDRHVVLATEGQEELARQFQRYDLMSAPVVDASNRLVGVVTVDDVVEVIQEEAEEDMKALAGVGDESLSDTVMEVARPRFWWLFVNLFTAILASLVIGLFRCHDREDGGIGRVDADRCVDGRQCRYANYDGRRSGPCNARTDRRQRGPRRLSRDSRRVAERGGIRGPDGIHRRLVVFFATSRLRYRRRDDHQSLRRGTGGDFHSARAQSRKIRPGRFVDGVRDDGYRCRRLLFISRSRVAVAEIVRGRFGALS